MEFVFSVAAILLKFSAPTTAALSVGIRSFLSALNPLATCRRKSLKLQCFLFLKSNTWHLNPSSVRDRQSLLVYWCQATVVGDFLVFFLRRFTFILCTEGRGAVWCSARARARVWMRWKGCVINIRNVGEGVARRPTVDCQSVAGGFSLLREHYIYMPPLSFRHFYIKNRKTVSHGIL